MAGIARVVVESRLPQLDRLLDYRIPDALAAAAQPGVRVRMPLRAGRLTTGFIVDVTDTPSFAGELADLEQVISPVPVLQREVWALARAVADRAAGNAADVLRVAIPSRQARVENAWLAASGAREQLALPERPVASPIPGAVEARRRIVLDAPAGVVQTASGTWVGQWAITLASLARDALERGEQAILVVPDHREQRQLVAALEDAVGAESIAQLDAKQSNPDRYRAFLRCVDGGPLAIVGPRSTVYAPAAALGLLAVWEDGDPLHHEPLAPYVSTRDAALVRQQQSGCALVLAAHARSTDAERLVELGWCEPETRAPRPPKALPAALTGDERGHRIPDAAFRALHAGLADGPVLVQVARPGHATGLACAACGERASCSACHGPLRRARREGVPSCAWCGRLSAFRCPTCSGTSLRDIGRGSVRTAEDLGRAFPSVPVVVADGEHERLEVDERPRLVIATPGAEPVAARGYRAVVLLDGERMLARESLRVSEAAVRHWATAISLAAPDASVVVTGAHGATAHALMAPTTAGFARAELEDRRALRFPPAVRVASLTGAADVVARAVRAIDTIGGVDVLGPVPVDGATRSIVRFEYSAGAELASALRSEILRAATQSRPVGARGAALRVRFDDHEPFEGL